MKPRIFSGAAAVLFATVALSGCATENTETADGAAVDASSKDVSCQIITSDLSEYTAQLAKGTDGFSEYTPSTMLSFQQGAVDKLTTVSQKLEHEGVKDAVLKLRDTASELVPPLEEIVENPETWTDGSMDAEIFEGNQRSTDALADLGELCPGVVETR